MKNLPHEENIVTQVLEATKYERRISLESVETIDFYPHIKRQFNKYGEELKW